MGVFKNGVGRPSNETIKKRNIFKGICVLFGLIIIVLVGYILNDKGIINISSKDNKKTVDKKTDKGATKENKKEEILDVNSDKVVNLFNKYNLFYQSSLYHNKNDMNCEFYSNNVGCNSFAYFYSKEKITKELLDDKIKLAYSIGNIYLNDNYKKDKYGVPELSDGEEYSFTEINKESSKLFGSDINFDNISITGSNGKEYADATIYGNSYLYTDKKLTLEKNGMGGVADIYFKTKIISAYEDNNKLYIENKVMFVIEDYQMFRILRKSSNNANEDILYDSSKNNATTNSISIDDYLDKLDTYRWTFKENTDGSYTFESVEKVK